MKTFHCNHCSHLVFFENVRCERCEALLGYVPELREISTFEEAGDARWRSLHPQAGGALEEGLDRHEACRLAAWTPASSA